MRLSLFMIFYDWSLTFVFLGGCNSNPCKNGGTCSEMKYDGIDKTVMKNAVSFKCECKETYSGARCEYEEGNTYLNDIYIYIYI